jgi:SAM-dependent methyltransferase
MQPSPEKSNDALVRQLTAWLDGIDYEIGFWGEWMRSKGGKWASDFTGRMDPERPIDPALFEGMDTSGTPKVLDVGAGPATYFGYKLNGRQIELSACDPLAPQYAKMAKENGVTWPVATVSGFAEDLGAFYPRGHFDLVVCRNALDHSFDPVRGIEEMLLVLKLGGRVNLIHYANEAEGGNYVGFHQWNFDVVNDRPIVWNKTHHVDLIERFGNCADITCNKTERWVRFRFDKKSEPEFPENRAQLRIAELLLATRDAFLSRQSAAKKGKEQKPEKKNRTFTISPQNPQGVLAED